MGLLCDVGCEGSEHSQDFNLNKKKESDDLLYSGNLAGSLIGHCNASISPFDLRSDDLDAGLLHAARVSNVVERWLERKHLWWL